MGESLGGAVAVDLAARDGARALVLESTFSSLPDVAAYHYPLLPVRWLMRTRFDSAGKIGDYHGPLLDGPRRRRHDRAAAVRPSPVRGRQPTEAFIVLPGHDHNDLMPPEFYDAVAEFLDGLR